METSWSRKTKPWTTDVGEQIDISFSKRLLFVILHLLVVRHPQTTGCASIVVHPLINFMFVFILVSFPRAEVLKSEHVSGWCVALFSSIYSLLWLMSE
jgi:hypothetical protein